MTESSETPAEDTPDPSRTRMVALDPWWLRRTLFVVFAGLIAYQMVTWAWGLLAHFLFNLLLAWLLAISFDPVVSRLAHKGMRRGAATGLVLVAGLALVVAFIAIFGSLFAAQVTELLIALPAVVIDAVDWFNGTFDAEINPVELTNNLNLTPQQITELLARYGGGIFGFFTGVMGAFFDFVTIAVFTFYFSADSPRIKRFVASWLRPSRQVVFIRVWDIAVAKAGGYVIARLALASISAIFHCAFFALIGVPYWLPMGIFAGLVSQFIPTVGTYIGVAVPALFALFDQPLDALWIALFAVVYQQIENYVLTPRISTRTMDMNSGVALAAVFIGAALFGPIGAFIGIPLVAIVIAVVEAYGQRYDIHPAVEQSSA